MNRMIHWMESAAALFLGAIMLLIAVSSVTRYTLNWPVPDSDTLVRMLLGATITWGLAVACARDEHIRVDLLWERLRAPAQRRLNQLASVVTLLVLALLASASVTRFLDVRRSGETSYDLMFPLWPFYAALALGLIVCCLVLARVALSGRAITQGEHHD